MPTAFAPIGITSPKVNTTTAPTITQPRKREREKKKKSALLFFFIFTLIFCLFVSLPQKKADKQD